MKIKLISLIVLTALAGICYNEDYVLIPECGAVKTFVVDKAFTDKFKITEHDFTLDYYDQLDVELPEEGQKNYEFIALRKLDENGDMLESFKVGSFEMTGGKDEELSKRYFEILKMSTDFFTFSYKVEGIETEMRTINGVDYHVLKATGILKDTDDENDPDQKGSKTFDTRSDCSIAIK